MDAALRIDDPVLERELADFVAAEAALLDAGRYDEWLALFAEDGRYWVPLQGARQADPHRHNSLAYEDRLLLALRVERLKNPRAHSQHPRSSCQHVLQRSSVEADDDGAEAPGCARRSSTSRRAATRSSRWPAPAGDPALHLKNRRRCPRCTNACTSTPRRPGARRRPPLPVSTC